ncbi:MAG: hypothetical protein Phyf2KO_26540 [Phycisphaerales bacterium]
MVDLVVFGLWVVVVVNAAIVLVPYLRGTGDLFTTRNFYLFGFTIYQVTSGIITLKDPFSYESQITLMNQSDTAIRYLLWLIVFEAVFLVFYQWGFASKRLARWTPIIKGQVREPVLWVFALSLLGVAVLMRFMVLVPYVSVISTQIGTSLAAVAAGLGAWIWVKRPLNPAAAALMFAVLFVAIIIGIFGEFGRRPLVAIGGCLVWGTYYAMWRYMPPLRVLVYAGCFSIIPIVLIANFTATRGQENNQAQSITSELQKLARGNTIAGFKDLMAGQQCAAWSMYLMEIYPDTLEYRHLHSIKYYFQLPIPRAIYPDKPDALGAIAWLDAGITGRPSGFTIGPGILGHAGSEGGFLVLILYGAVLGLFIRYFDAIVARAPYQPFVALPIGSSMGNLLGLPRGEVPNFAFSFTVGVLGALVILIVIARLLKAIGYITDDDFITDDEHELDVHDEPDYPYDGQYDPAYANYGKEED